MPPILSLIVGSNKQLCMPDAGWHLVLCLHPCAVIWQKLRFGQRNASLFFARAMRYLLPDPRQSVGSIVCSELRSFRARTWAHRASSFNVFSSPSHPWQHGSTESFAALVAIISAVVRNVPLRNVPTLRSSQLQALRSGRLPASSPQQQQPPPLCPPPL